MEIVLGIDNIIFIALLCGYIPKRADQRRARTIGLSLALVFRILLLAFILSLVSMVKPLFFIGDYAASGRDLVLFGGGLFLIYKTVQEIIQKLKSTATATATAAKTILSVTQAIIQITIIDIIFSFDSILTAVGLSRNLIIMITAVICSMFVMLFFAHIVSDFINKYPTIKMIALVFLVCIGVLLLSESLHIHIEKNYVYVAMGFAVLVEMLNIRMKKIS